MFRPYLGSLLGASALLAVHAAVPGASAWLLHRAIAEARPGDPGASALYAASIAGVAAAGAIIGILRSSVTRRVGWSVATELRMRAHAALLTRNGPLNTGNHLTLLGSDPDEVTFAVSAAVTAFRNPLTLLVLGWTAWTLAPGLAPWAFAVLPAVGLVGRHSGRWVRRRSDAAQRARARWSALVHDQLLGRDVIAVAGAEDREQQRFREASIEDSRHRAALDVARTVPSALVEVVAAMGVGALAWRGGEEVAAGRIDTAAFTGFALAVVLMTRPLAGLTEVWTLAHRAYAAFVRLDRVWTTPESAKPERMTPAGRHLEWRSVTVDYGEHTVLRDVSLIANPGEILAVVGPSGAGKSTLLRAAVGLCDLRTGEMALGGDGYAGCPPLRTGYVDQNTHLFARSVEENLRIATPDASDEQLWEALRLASISSRIAAAPEGLRTPVSELGRTLSGGERQRLCLARALVGSPGVLLLDEATNQLDAPTEAEILRTLHQLKAGRTIVLVAHHLAVAAEADRVAVIVDGEVREHGTPAELLTSEGWFASAARASRGAA